MGPGGSSVLLFQFSTFVRPQSESHPQAEFRLLFTRVGAHQGTESVGGISSAASLIMQSWCRNLDTVQPYCFFSRPLTQSNHSKILAVVHKPAEFLSVDQRCTGSTGSGSAMILMNFASSMPGLWATVLDRNSPSLCSLLSHFFLDILWHRFCLGYRSNFWALHELLAQTFLILYVV